MSEISFNFIDGKINGVSDHRYDDLNQRVRLAVSTTCNNSVQIFQLKDRLNQEIALRDSLQDGLISRIRILEITLILLLTALALAFVWPILWVLVYFVVVNLVIAVAPWSLIHNWSQRGWREVAIAVREAWELYQPSKEGADG